MCITGESEGEREGVLCIQFVSRCKWCQSYYFLFSLRMGQVPFLPGLFLLIVATLTHSLNLDTKFPVKLVQPLRSNGSHFGYSVAADVRTSNPRYIPSLAEFFF